MILSTKLGLVFLKGKKVGGTSIEVALSALCGPDDIVTPLVSADDRFRIRAGNPPRNYARSFDDEREYISTVLNTPREQLGQVKARHKRFSNHTSRAALDAELGPLDGFTFMCAERSPYEKVVSLAKWRLAKFDYLDGVRPEIDIASLRAKLDELYELDAFRDVRNIDRYRGTNGELPDIVLRHETLAEDFARAMASLGVTCTLPPDRFKQSAALAAPLEHVLSRRHIDKINEDFADEFAAFGYPPM